MSRFEIVSGDEVLLGNGDEVDALLSGQYELVGARRRALAHGPRGGGALAAAAAAKVAQAGTIVRQHEPTKARKIVLPMASTGTVAAAATSSITARPQTVAFKPTRVVVPASIAPDFTINDIKVGVKSQFAQSGALPAEMFTQNAFDVDMDMDTVQTSQDFVLDVANISGGARQFRAGVRGVSAD